MKILPFALMLASMSLQANTYVYTGAWSQHVGSNKLNETHNLFAAEHQDWLAGYFKNSYDRDTFVAAYRWSWDLGYDLEFSALGGASYGYTNCIKGNTKGGDKRACLLVSPALTYTKWAIQPSFTVLGSAVAMTLRWDISSLVSGNAF